MEHFISIKQESGYSASTLTSNKRYLHVFLTFMEEEEGIGSLHSIQPSHIIAFIESQKNKSLTTKYGMFGVIRNFLKYLHSLYPDTSDLSAIIPKVNYVREAKLPSVYSRLKIALRRAANSIGNLKGTHLSEFFKRIAYRKGRMAAVSATVRKLAIIIWNMVTKREPYKPPIEYIFRDQKRKMVRQMKRKIRKMGIAPEDLGFLPADLAAT